MRAFVLCVVLVGAARGDERSLPGEQARALFKEGQQLYQEGQYGRAIDRYKQAFALVPMPIMLFDLGQAYRLKGDREKAVDHYRKYLDVEPNGRAADEARARLTELRAELDREAAEKQKRTAEEARLRSAAEAKNQAAMAEWKQKAEENARQRARLDAERRELDAMAVRLRATEDARRPPWKKAWFWIAVGGAALVVGTAVGLGAGLGTRDHDPTASLGKVPAN